MITRAFYKSIGLTKKQIEAVEQAVEKEQYYVHLLVEAGLHEDAIFAVLITDDTSIIHDISDNEIIKLIKKKHKNILKKTIEDFIKNH